MYVAVAPIIWAKGVIAVLAFAATIPAARILADPLRRLLDEETEVDIELLINQVGLTDVGEVRLNFGRALVQIQDREISVEIRCKEGSIRPRGVPVRMVEYNEEGKFFWVERA